MSPENVERNVKSVPNEEARPLTPEEIEEAQKRWMVQSESQQSSTPEEREKFQQQYKRKLERAQTAVEIKKENVEHVRSLMSEVRSLPVGSREKYEAAYKMYDKAKELIADKSLPRFSAGESTDSTGYPDMHLDDLSLDGLGGVRGNPDSPDKAAFLEKAGPLREEINEANSMARETFEDARILWFQARGEHEQAEDPKNTWYGPAAKETALVYKELKGDVDAARVISMLESKDIHSDTRAEIAFEATKKFIAEGKHDDAAAMMIHADRAGFEFGVLTDDFVRKYDGSRAAELQRLRALRERKAA